jgi:predicted transcriptional regulator
MATTTIRLEGEMKARAAAAAERAGKSPRAFILDAIAQTVEEAELDLQLERVADERWTEILANGETIPWERVKRYLEARARGERPRRLAVRKSTR